MLVSESISADDREALDLNNKGLRGDIPAKTHELLAVHRNAFV